MAEPRIGIARQGDIYDAAAWSGVLATLLDGLTQAGASVAPIRADVPWFRRVNELWLRDYAAEFADAPTAAISSRAAARGLRRAGAVDGVLQLGSGFVLPQGTRYVTYDDMTVLQALGMPDEAYRQLSPRAAQRWADRQRGIYEHAVACCVGSRWAARSVIADYGIPAERVHVVGFGRNSAAEPAERDWTTPRFLLVGREWERKNGPRVLRAFARVREQWPQARLDLVGGHPPVDQPGVVGHGHLRHDDPAQQQELRGLMQAATCLVMVASYEPFGIAHVDAAGTGLPSIGSTVGGGQDAVGPGGVVIDPEDDEALLGAMLRLADPATAALMSAAAILHARLFERRIVAERLLRALLGPADADARGLAAFLHEPSSASQLVTVADDEV